MSNFFKNAHARTTNSPAMIVIWLVLLTAFIIACGVAIEDYSTSLLGYQSIPTQKANDWVIPMVALMPQVIQIVLFFNFLTDTDNKRWSLFAAIVVHFVDVSLDVYYKSNGFDGFGLTLTAFIESEIIYTFGSEILLTMSFGLMIATFPGFLVQARRMFHNIVDAISDDHKKGGGGQSFDYGDRDRGQSRSPVPSQNRLDIAEMEERAAIKQQIARGSQGQIKLSNGVIATPRPGGMVVTKKPGKLDRFLKR